jgi:acetyltransferase-like isoleucine patch superfamily enzyme
LGNGVVVGAGSVVSGLIAKDGSKVVGNPAQIK